ncbi:hypothetical protein GUITHDRAFT_99632 [Guillardia theta CCMP2712]|uniref:Uncharacterized protein n=1 Tax=Guillardia theta (strain CCMP2712) TaxID=905079 RepID=L1K2D3_GUITC|nr:hypothetical protein GUITHDRAFT_99632 [Guillardia theta CCMP2712]EKX54986.1 hypothetical protein GUITHDRAFT_99632 [Guillardia theta CCMP2712]|eukprot:XP_005841966.1 hypothetical protein GUITHDRAFT_99632 [Guillardia theta CCMP2712]
MQLMQSGIAQDDCSACPAGYVPRTINSACQCVAQTNASNASNITSLGDVQIAMTTLLGLYDKNQFLLSSQNDLYTPQTSENTQKLKFTAITFRLLASPLDPTSHVKMVYKLVKSASDGSLREILPTARYLIVRQLQADDVVVEMANKSSSLSSSSQVNTAIPVS